MTEYEKDILSKDLCARLPYGVKVLYDNQIFEVQYIEPMYGELKLLDNETYTLPIEEVKPYLIPLSYMTEEQDKQFGLLQAEAIKCEFLYPCNCANLMRFIYENHLDYMDLIGKGLAIDATNKNIY